MSSQGIAVPELYCPSPVRDDPDLGELLNEQLVQWAEQVGIYPGQPDTVREAAFGRMMMLCFPGTDDPDRLLAAGKCILAQWAVDDTYVDDESLGATVQLQGSRLALAKAALDPVHLPSRYAPDLEQVMRDDPVLAAHRSSLAHLAQYADSSQLARYHYEMAGLYVANGTEATWRSEGRLPQVWEYLTNRQPNSFLPSMVMLDPIGGYQLPFEMYADPRVRRVFMMAGAASVMVNDLFSMTREGHASGLDFNLPTVIAAEDKCSLKEAIQRSAEFHNEMMHRIEAEATALSADGTPALRRFLADVWAWLGGNRAWHAGSARYSGISGMTN
ncbi:family 2 encapsulin nanocompartment cargo protein terpene cyclase [Streptomyces sp. NPDC048389]|uniref:family 2 encapsulin nanocompartment cargo protein terpene cyclase n=1 Tax=Streptomyces sp. NPDC048389 TaxID=3154622 RepID=UPI003453E7C9